MVAADCIEPSPQPPREFHDLSVTELLSVKIEAILGIPEIPLPSIQGVSSKKGSDLSVSELSPNSLEVVYEKSIHADSESSVSTSPPPHSSEKAAEKPMEARWGRWMENSESSTCLVCGRAFGWLRRRHVAKGGSG